MRNNPQKVQELLENENTSAVLINSTTKFTKIEIDLADTFGRDWTPPVEKDTPIVRLQTRENEYGEYSELHFDKETILNGEIVNSTTLKAKDVTGTEHTLEFLQETPARLENSNSLVICANDSPMHVVTPEPGESTEEFHKRTQEKIEELAFKAFKHNESHYTDQPHQTEEPYKAYRNQVYWHTHGVSAS